MKLHLFHTSSMISKAPRTSKMGKSSPSGRCSDEFENPIDTPTNESIFRFT